MLLVAIGYLLLAMEITVRGRLCLFGDRGCVQLEAGALGVFVHIDNEVLLRGGRVRVLPRYGPARRKPAGHGSVRRLRAAKPYLLAALRAGRLAPVRLAIRLGLDDARYTAVAAGAVRAAVSALLCGLGTPLELLVEPDFRAPCFLLAAQGIFSARPGDIMFAVLRTALNKKRREGFGWKSIPLRA